MEYATKEGTFAYLKKFSKYNKDFFRYSGEYFVSSLGLGTFRKEPYREENYVIHYKDAVKSAIENGINVIDTAINYRYQVSEQEIGETLEEMISAGQVGREALVITSKAGFVPLEFPFPENPYEWIEENIVDKGLAAKEEIVIDQHCMSPEYLRWSVEQSLQNLKLDTLDILYLHNPETQLGYVDRDVVLARIKEAFRLFESLVEEGKIRAYGVAAWNAFLYEEGHTEYLGLSDIVKIAQEAGGTSHHFKYLQVPFNLAKPHAYSYSNQKGPDGKYYTLMQAVHGYELGLFASSSLLQMNLFKGKFSDEVRAALETESVTDVATALQFARSGNVLSALFGSIEPQHIRENLMLAYLNETKPAQIQNLFGVKDVV